MEREIQIETVDSYVMDGVLNSKGKTDKLIIFVHGLTGHKNEHHFFNAAKYFTQKGFDTFRFDLYSGGEKHRSLRDCTIKTHSRDLEKVISYFDTKYSETYLVGHSLGGATILWSDYSNIKSVVLWDPSYKIIDKLSEDLYFEEKMDLYIVNWGAEFLISKEMVEEWKLLDERLLDCIVKPTKIICAEKSILNKSWGESIGKLNIDYDFVTIENARHCFDEYGTEEKLFKETLDWFMK